MATSLMAKRLAQVRDFICCFNIDASSVRETGDWSKGDAEYTAILSPDFTDQVLKSWLAKFADGNLEKWVMGVSATELTRQSARLFQISGQLENFRHFLDHHHSPHLDKQIWACWGVHQLLLQAEVLGAQGKPSDHIVSRLDRFLKSSYSAKDNTFSRTLPGLSVQDQKRVSTLFPDRVFDDSGLPMLREEVTSLGFTVRTENCLNAENISTLGQLLARSETDLLRSQNFGRKSLNEVREVLRQRGLSLGSLPIKAEVPAEQ